MKSFKVNEHIIKEIVYYFSHKEEIVIEINSLNNNDKIFLSKILKLCLQEIDKIGLFNYLNYCLNELLENANRANIKRIFFEEKHLNINNSEDYRKGMKIFNRFIIDNKNHYLKIFKLFNFYIKISFKIEDNVLIISVKNNAVILNEELNIAREKINNAKIFSSIEEAFLTVQNKSEGGGLGLIIIILLLRKIGLTRNSFNIFKSKNETICSIMIPLSFISLNQNKTINNIIFNEINNIPQLPKNIINLQNLIIDNKIKTKKIKELISFDQKFINYIIKFINSISLLSEYKKYTIDEVIKLINFNQLKELLYSYCTIKILCKRYSANKINKILTHSNKVAFFAVQIAKLLLNKKNLEEIYTVGILHDIGHIILNRIKEDSHNKLNNISKIKSIQVISFENISSGYNHAIIGATLAKKWNFPDKYICAIEFHNNPIECCEEYKTIIYPIYIAEIMSQNKDPYEIYKSINKHALFYFKIHSFSEYRSLSDKIIEEYNKKNNVLIKTS